MTELKSILYYLDVEIDRELKADLNISMGEGVEGKGKVEIKNVTGMKNLLDAARYEVQRQGKLIGSGKKVETETRSYNEAKMETVSSREKESDEEYGFIFEPDLTVYSTANLRVKTPVYASKIAKELAGKSSDREETVRGLVLFNRRALELLESVKGKHDIKNAITAVELLQRYGTAKSGHGELEKVIALLEKGSYPDKGTIRDLEQGKEVAAVHSAFDNKTIDKEIREMIEKNRKLLEEYRKNDKVFNFIVGAIIRIQGKPAPGLRALDRDT